MDFFTAMEVSASGMTTERTRLTVASSNLANASTTSAPDGGPYKRRDVVVKSQTLDGPDGAFAAHVAKIQQDKSPPRLEYDPGHPDANSDGYVAYPNVNSIEEMVDMITASRAYQAGGTALDSEVSLAERALGIGR